MNKKLLEYYSDLLIKRVVERVTSNQHPLKIEIINPNYILFHNGRIIDRRIGIRMSDCDYTDLLISSNKILNENTIDKVFRFDFEAIELEMYTNKKLILKFYNNYLNYLKEIDNYLNKELLNKNAKVIKTNLCIDKHYNNYIHMYKNFYYEDEFRFIKESSVGFFTGLNSKYITNEEMNNILKEFK